MSQGHMLVCELDHRNPSSDLADVETGKALQAMSELPASIRMLLEDSNIHVQLEEVEGKYRIVKIVKKRDPGYVQGTENYFIFDSEGKRIPLTEEEYSELLGMKQNPEDVLSLDEEQLEGIDSSVSVAMDMWDVVYDASEFVGELKRLAAIQDETGEPISAAKITDLSEKLIYSADWFPYPTDKRLSSSVARKIADLIETRNLSRQQLASMLGNHGVDNRLDIVKSMRVKAGKLSPGKEKAALLNRAQSLFDLAMRDLKGGTYQDRPVVPTEDKAKLWALWRSQQISDRGEVQLMSWQYEKMERAKLQKNLVAPYQKQLDARREAGEISKDEYRDLLVRCQGEAAEALSASMQKLFGVRPGQRVERTKAPILRASLPSWIEDAPPMPEASGESDDWVPPDGEVEDSCEFSFVDENQEMAELVDME